MSEAVDPPREGLLFDAVLYPHRSLGRAGFYVLMGILIVICAVFGVVFLLAGAWPVFGFFGLDILLLYIAFRVNYRAGLISETVRLTRDRLVVRRISPAGRVQAWDFQPHWLRVDIDEPPEPQSQLTLSSHGRRLTIGSFLSPGERVEFARALRDALRRCRTPPSPA